MVSRTHARVNITDHIEVIDLGSANGVELNGSLVSRGGRAVFGQGEYRGYYPVVSVHAGGERRGAHRFGLGGVHFAPPDWHRSIPVGTSRLPRRLQRSQKQPFPVMMLVLPILMAGVLYLVTKQATTLLFAGLSPLMMIASWWENRRHMRQVDKAALEGFRSDLRGLVGELQQEQVTEVTGRLHEHPSAIECATAARDRRPLLWTRRPDDWGFLEEPVRSRDAAHSFHDQACGWQELAP